MHKCMHCDIVKDSEFWFGIHLIVRHGYTTSTVKELLGTNLLDHSITELQEEYYEIDDYRDSVFDRTKYLTGKIQKIRRKRKSMIKELNKLRKERDSYIGKRMEIVALKKFIVEGTRIDVL